MRIQRTHGVSRGNHSLRWRVRYQNSIGNRSSSLIKYTRKWSSTRKMREYKRDQRSKASNARPENQSNAFKGSIGLEIQEGQEDLATKDRARCGQVWLSSTRLLMTRLWSRVKWIEAKINKSNAKEEIQGTKMPINAQEVSIKVPRNHKSKWIKTYKASPTQMQMGHFDKAQWSRHHIINKIRMKE